MPAFLAFSFDGLLRIAGRLPWFAPASVAAASTPVVHALMMDDVIFLLLSALAFQPNPMKSSFAAMCRWRCLL